MKKCTSAESLKNMSEYKIEKRKRRQNLLIVEGFHEKNKLFWLMFQCFPEVSIDMKDIWIYGTNIYLLYEDIVKEYGCDWSLEGYDIDLPFVISKKQHLETICYKEDFTNIILVFDYERHDTKFSEKKILELQCYFRDAADMGKLYINYPMIESYQHFISFQDDEYENRKIPVSLQPGRRYKEIVNQESVICKIVEFPHKIDDLLDKCYGMKNEQKRKECCNIILNISKKPDMDRKLQDVIQNLMEIKDNRRDTIKYQLINWLMKLGYVNSDQTYWQYTREVFKQIIIKNICKANKIQNGEFKIREEQYKLCFDRLDLIKILRIQNCFSRETDKGYIWVLNTCLFFIAEYNFKMIMEEG